MKKGDLVQYWHDAGCAGYQPLYGVVTKAGSKTFTVQWESGVINRRPQGDHLVKSLPERSRDEVKQLLTERGILPA